MYQEVDGRLSPQPFVQLFWDFDNWPLNRGWLLKIMEVELYFVGKLQCRASHTSDAGLMAFFPQ